MKGWWGRWRKFGGHTPIGESRIRANRRRNGGKSRRHRQRYMGLLTRDWLIVMELVRVFLLLARRRQVWQELGANWYCYIVRRHQKLRDFGSAFVEAGAIFRDCNGIICEWEERDTMISIIFHIFDTCHHIWHHGLMRRWAEICWQPLEFSGFNFSPKVTHKPTADVSRRPNWTDQDKAITKLLMVKSSLLEAVCWIFHKELERCNLKIVINAKQRSTQFSSNLLALKSH